MVLSPSFRKRWSWLRVRARRLSSRWWSSRRRFADLPSWALGIIGCFSALSAAYWGLGLTEVAPGYVRVVNELGHLNEMAFRVGVMLFMLGLQVWFFGMVAARCTKLLSDRLLW